MYLILGYTEALKEQLDIGPYGRCVFHCDNDVADHQCVNMQFENGATATMNMLAFTKDMCRFGEYSTMNCHRLIFV